jgi:transposase
MTKSPSRLAREALELGRKALPAYSGRFSRHDYSQPQLFAILVLKVFFKTDYRGIVAILNEWSSLRRTLGLKKVPHYSTLCYAQERLLREGQFDGLMHAAWEQARRQGLIDSKPQLAIDATGLETRHVSAHYMNRRGEQRFEQKTWPKLTAVCHTATHLIAGAVAGRGPSSDSSQCPPAIRQAAANVKASRLLGDKGYDSEPIHQLCRDELGIRSTVIPLNPRNTGRRWPKTKYRRQMRKRFFRRAYGQRWQVESAFSRHKRRLGSALTTRSQKTQQSEVLLRVLVHNLLILRLPTIGFQQSSQSAERTDWRIVQLQIA